jgi:hypothetical protein
MFNFTKLRDDLGALAAQAKKLRDTIEGKRRLREDLITLPLPQADFADMVCDLIDSEAAKFPEQLNLTLIQRMQMDKRPQVTLAGKMMAVFSSDASKGAVTQAALCFIFKDQVKRAVTDSIMSWDWPSEVGPTRAERQARIEKVESEIDQLERQAKEVQDQAGTLGITL